VPPKRKNFFAQEERQEDVDARMREVAAVLAPKRLVIQEVGEERITANPFQARRTFGDLEDLANSIRVHGFTTRLRVRPEPERPGYFQLVYGERRLRAARIAGLREIPCEIAEHSNDEMIEIGLAENIQRQDLAPLEEAQAFQLFISERGYSVRRLAERIGKGKSYVEDRVALLRMPADVQQLITERPDALRMAREIAKLPTSDDRKPLIDAVMTGQLATSDVRALVRSAANPMIDAVVIQGSSPQIPLRQTPPSPYAAEPHQPEEISELPPIDMSIRTVARINQRSLERDIQIVRNILARWRVRMVESDQAQEQVRTALEQIMIDAGQLTNALEREH
jgi:ParB family transcriptional regulator, chromosome partitioning protein